MNRINRLVLAATIAAFSSTVWAQPVVTYNSSASVTLPNFSKDGSIGVWQNWNWYNASIQLVTQFHTQPTGTTAGSPASSSPGGSFRGIRVASDNNTIYTDGADPAVLTNATTPKAVNTLAKYDRATNTWTQIGNGPFGLIYSGTAGTLMTNMSSDGKWIVGKGWRTAGATQGFIYNSITNTWHLLSYPTGYTSGGPDAVSEDGKTLYGWVQPNAVPVVWKYDPDTDTDTVTILNTSVNINLGAVSPDGQLKAGATSNSVACFTIYDAANVMTQYNAVNGSLGSPAPITHIAMIGNDGFSIGAVGNIVTGPAAYIRFPNQQPKNFTTYLATRGVGLGTGSITGLSWVSEDRDTMIGQGTPPGGAGARLVTITKLLPRIKGTITLSEYIPTPDNQKVTVRVTDLSDTLVATYPNVSLSTTGAYEIKTSLPDDTYNVTIQGKHWLAKKVAGVAYDGNFYIADATLTNGDIDGDNIVSVFDYGILSDYFDKSSADSDWTTVGANNFAPVDADLDGDNTVSVFDYGILSNSFDQSGD